MLYFTSGLLNEHTEDGRENNNNNDNSNSNNDYVNPSASLPLCYTSSSHPLSLIPF